MEDRPPCFEIDPFFKGLRSEASQMEKMYNNRTIAIERIISNQREIRRSNRRYSFQERVISALHQRHPFTRFKELVEYSEYRKKWFDLKQKQLEE